MLQTELPEKVSIEVIEKDKHFFANVGFNQSRHSLGPTTSRDEIYQLIFNFIHDIRLISEIEYKRKTDIRI